LAWHSALGLAGTCNTALPSALGWPREGGVGVARRGRSLAGWEALTQPRPARWEGPWEAWERCTLPAVYGVALAPLSQPARALGHHRPQVALPQPC